MTALGVDARLGALAEALELADGRLEPERVRSARGVVERAGQRLGLGVEVTVVALAGPTGAGKSTLFNALAGADLVPAGRRRPTTSTSTAAVWGEVGDPLLDWLEVPRRHRLDDDGRDGRGAGFVLLDLPDFDSVEERHHREVDRLVELVDLVAWVVDPQKYADGAWHERYLRPLAGHGEVMLVVLNQADLLTPEAVEACRVDLQGLLREDGLASLPVLPASARTGQGLDALREALEERAAVRGAAVARLAADLDGAAGLLGAGCADGAPGEVRKADRDRLLVALGSAAGVPTVVAAVERSHRRRGALATGWPAVRWLRRLRPDPLRRLHLADGPQPDVRTSLPGPSPVQRAQVEAASRTLAAGASEALADPWPRLVREAATRDADALADHLDRAVGGAELHASSPRWWRPAGLLQRLLAAVALVGALWLLVLVALGYLQLGDVVPVPEVEGFALPTLLLAGGILLGLLFALLTRVVNGWGARRRARAAERSLRARVEEVAADRVIGPVEAELAVHAKLCEATARAAGGGPRRSWRGLRRSGAVRAGAPA